MDRPIESFSQFVPCEMSKDTSPLACVTYLKDPAPRIICDLSSVALVKEDSMPYLDAGEQFDCYYQIKRICSELAILQRRPETT